MRRQVEVRPLSVDDFRAVGRIFFCAVHEGTRGAYTHEQRLAWGGETIDLARWKKRLETLSGFVAVDEGEPVGFIAIDEAGYVDLAYVLPSATGRGAGRALLNAAEQWASAHGATELSTAASLVARPFFERNGWSVLEEEQVERAGVFLTRFRMQKVLAQTRA
jgi:putative acetyltransferase